LTNAALQFYRITEIQRDYFSILRGNMMRTLVRDRINARVFSDLPRNYPIKVMNEERKGVSFIKRGGNASTATPQKTETSAYNRYT